MARTKKTVGQRVIVFRSSADVERVLRAAVNVFAANRKLPKTQATSEFIRYAIVQEASRMLNTAS